MTAINVVRFRVKPGYEQQFVDAHRNLRPAFNGFVGGSLIRTGDRTFCMIGEWANFQKIVDARPQMVGVLDQLRDMLEDLGNGLGLTDPVSGEVVSQLPGASAPRKKKAAPKRRKKAKVKAKSRAKKRSRR